MKKKVAIYCRVSTSDQDISGQLKSLPEFAESQGWKIFDTYVDEGISGATIEARPEFKRLIDDMVNQRFNILLAEFHDRITRTDDLRERGLIMQILKENNIMMWSPSEGHSDLTTDAGEITTNIKFIISAQEKKRIKDRTVKGKVRKVREQKDPTAIGRQPFARRYNKETGEWVLDKKKANLIRWAADEYLKGESLRDIAHLLSTRHDLSISYVHLTRILRNSCGDTWIINFEGEEPITFKVLRILDEKTIEAVRNRLDHNRTFNRKDSKKYLLTGFIRCGECGKALSGQNPQHKKYSYRYYRHVDHKYVDCKAFRYITADNIENAVFKTLFENVADEIGFNEAIKNSLPDEEYIETLQRRIANNEKGLKKTDNELDELVELATSGTLRKETIKKKEDRLYENKQQISDELEADKQKLSALPSIEKIKKKAERIRMGLFDYFGSIDRLNEMSFEEKRQLLHWMFDGTDEDGFKHGIYITKKGKNRWSYTIDAQFLYGTRNMKGDNIDYWDEELTEESNRRLHDYFNTDNNSRSNRNH